MNSAKDAVATLGTVLDETAARDAIHVAVEPAIAAHMLRPGQRVGRLAGRYGVSGTVLGIVDPFLTRNVKTGERFWLFVLPRTITGLRHVWTHPAWPDEPQKAIDDREISVAFLADFAANIGEDYEWLMEQAEYWLEYGDYYTQQGSSHMRDSWPSDFWKHYEIATGKAVPEEQRESFFSCSC